MTVDTFAPVAPVMASIALRTSCTVAVLPVPMPIVTLPVASVADAAVAVVLKVMVLPSTVSVEPSVIAVARSLEAAPAVPTSLVAAVIARGGAAVSVVVSGRAGGGERWLRGAEQIVGGRAGNGGRRDEDLVE